MLRIPSNGPTRRHSPFVGHGSDAAFRPSKLLMYSPFGHRQLPPPTAGAPSLPEQQGASRVFSRILRPSVCAPVYQILQTFLANHCQLSCCRGKMGAEHDLLTQYLNLNRYIVSRPCNGWRKYRRTHLCRYRTTDDMQPPHDCYCLRGRRNVCYVFARLKGELVNRDAEQCDKDDIELMNVECTICAKPNREVPLLKLLLSYDPNDERGQRRICRAIRIFYRSKCSHLSR